MGNNKELTPSFDDVEKAVKSTK